ncbi:unnamed protein product, partial [marine sediment metagenome]
DYNYNMSSPYDDFNYNMSEATFDYNMTDGAFDIYGEWFYNMSSPYDVFNYNMTDTTFDYNMSRTDAEILGVCSISFNYTLLSNFTDDILWTTDFNNSVDDRVGTENASWNESGANILYAPNTTEGIQYLINDTDVYGTHNATYDALITDNVTWNESAGRTIWDDYNYNQTTPANSYTDSKLNTTFYTAASVLNVTGTVEGALEDIQTFNTTSYNLSEVDSDFDLRVNFTSVDDLNQVIYRYKSELDEPHIMHAQIWSYTDGDWHGLAEEGSRE